MIELHGANEETAYELWVNGRQDHVIKMQILNIECGQRLKNI